MTHYVGLLSGIAGLLVVVSSLAGARASSDDGSQRGVGLRSRISIRYRAHPRAIQLQFGCLAAAIVLLLAAAASYIA